MAVWRLEKHRFATMDFSKKMIWKFKPFEFPTIWVSQNNDEATVKDCRRIDDTNVFENKSSGNVHDKINLTS